MKTYPLLLFVACLSLICDEAFPALGSTTGLKLTCPYGYLPANPIVVRVEALNAQSQPDRDLWDGEVTLSAGGGVNLSPNRVTLRNGLGSALITCSGGGDFTLTATLGTLSTNRPLVTLAAAPVATFGGSLPGGSTTWSGVVKVTNNLTVPVGHTLTILSNTLVLFNGVASGAGGAGLTVIGRVLALGTEDQPITFTSADPTLNWGEIRHTNATLSGSVSSTYQYALFSKAGRSSAVGHTSTGPLFRLFNASNLFDHCTLSDLVGKTMYASGSDLSFSNCHLARSIMGPEITATALQCRNTWITDMFGTPTAPEGTNDNDGIYLWGQQAGQNITLSGCVLAAGHDDAIDTFGSSITVTNCILRDWTNPNEDAKGISCFDGTVTLRRCLVVNCFVGVAMKTSSASSVGRVNISESTIQGLTRGLAANVKGNAPGPIIDFRVTNCIVRAPDAIYSDFGPTNFTIGYSALSEAWAGTGNLTANPLLVDEPSWNFHLWTSSPCINAGDPAGPADPDASRADIGFFAFDATQAVGLFAAITAPADGSVATAPTNIVIDVNAASSTGTLARVEFYQGAVKLGEDQTAPYSLTWSNPAAGIYTLRAIAIDTTGVTKTSAPVNVTVNSGAGATTNTLISFGSVWKYLDNGSNQGTNWVSSIFDDSAWAAGPAQLGYGDGDEATVVSFGPNSSAKFVTTYFRHTFTGASSYTNLDLKLLRDDAGIVYLNGVEVFRSPNLPAGPVAFDVFALVTGENTLDTTNFPPSQLLEGPNVVAVEIHQQAGTSSDISFDLQLSGVAPPQANARPLVALTSPTEGTLYGTPASIPLAALASDSDGTVTNVAFFANGSKLADTTLAPYGFTWNNPAAGAYALTAAATDNLGQSTTSSPVNITVSANVAAPVVAAKLPAPGAVTNLTQIAVTFSKVVAGVNASDLLINGVPATGLSGSGSNYTFTFTQPLAGTVSVTWAAGHGIVDTFVPAHAFNTNSAGANWQYLLQDASSPFIVAVAPVPGETLAALTRASVTFSEPVNGVSVGDLLVNGLPSVGVSGSGAGPYTFSFAQPAEGTVVFSWASGHGIQDSTGNALIATPWSCVLDTNSYPVVFSEIMYHPASENPLDEWIELFNRGTNAVSLNGWRVHGGIDFTFSNVTLAAGAYLVVTADRPTFAARYPTVTNVVGNWTGLLNNSAKTLHLDDATGAGVASVRYADEGDWAVRQRGVLDLGYRGWDWFAEHDGFGKSAELINPALVGDQGQNWAPSQVTNGTPGRANSVLTNSLAPLILEVRHVPTVPRTTDPVLVVARIVDEAPGVLAAAVNYRVSVASPGPFVSLPMHDDGLNGDAVAGDGLFSATLPAQPANTVVEFYLSATDVANLTRTWPAPAVAAPDGAGPTGQVVNALYQVDDAVYNPTNHQPLYKLIMTESERLELQSIPGNSTLQGPNAAMNGTFISLDAGATELRYLASFRNRGHGSRTANPPNYHVTFRSDEPWKGVSGINLNTRFVHIQHLGSVVSRLAGVAGAETVAVQVRVNNQNRANAGAPMWGSYAANEVLDGDWSAKHFPNDPNGNVYRAVRDIAPPDFSYRGENPSSYANTFFKQSNISENDWSDLIGMLRVVGVGNLVSFTTDNVRQVVDVEQWMQHLALMNIMGNNETGLNSGYNDDYYLYAGKIDRRLLLSYWDLDTILGDGDSPMSPTVGIYTATANNGAGQAFDRFLHWPDFEPIYLRTLLHLLQTTFAPSNFNPVVDQTLGGYVDPGTIGNLKNWMDQRRTFLLTSVLTNVPPASNAPTATLTGIPRSPTPLTTASLLVGGPGVVSYRFKLNNGAFGAETPVATPNPLSGLANGTNTASVIGKDANGVWQDPTNATVRRWVVNTAWPAVRLNEVLARNDTAVNHSGTFPDVLELFNEGGSSLDLSGLCLTTDPAEPSRFVFPGGTTLPAGAYLVVYANNPDGTPGIHLGFSLNQQGESIYLLDRAANGNTVLDSVSFGLQVADLSIGRVLGGDWTLTQPTFGAVNTDKSLGDPGSLRLNEWLASGLPPYADDFIELYNSQADPVAVGGLHLTDQPIGAPKLHPIAALSFIPAHGFLAFLADGHTGNGAEHVSFQLAYETGEIGLTAADGSVIDQIIYGPQQPGVASGRCPDGAISQVAMSVPTPGSPNACPVAPPAPQALTLVPLNQTWRYDQSGSNLGTTWRAGGYDDSAWPSGPALLALDSCGCLPDTIRTPLTVAAGRITYYFRTHFNVASNLSISQLSLSHVIDDGAVVYLNGVEVHRTNMPAGTITFTTQASSAVNHAVTQGPFGISLASLIPGDNVLAVEVHQNGTASPDVAFGLKLDDTLVTNTPALAGVVINEVLANNASLEEPDGRKPDWVEIYNPSLSAVDLGDTSLTDDALQPRRWVFPAGSFLPAHGFLKVRFDGDLPPSATNTGFGLKATGGAVYLFNRPADGAGPASSIIYGLQAGDWSIGRVPDGGTNLVLTLPTFGAANIAASLGVVGNLKINEWMAAPASGDDWFELYNPNSQPVELSGLWLSDDFATPQKYQIPPRSYLGIGPNGFLRFWAANGADADFTGFNLRANGEAVLVSSVTGVLINGVGFGQQLTGVSQGRLPDGSATLASFPITPTPGKANFLPLDEVVISELLSHTDAPLEDAVEIQNLGAEAVDLSGWYLSDAQNNLLKYRIPPGTTVASGGFAVFYEYQFNFGNLDVPFSFSSAKGDEVYLSQATGPGVLTGYRAFAEFGPAENGVSFGRYRSSVGVDFTAMSARTFGADSPATTNEFRTGTGKTNTYPKVGPVVINEIMYHPPGTNDALEFVELLNVSGTDVPLYDAANPGNTWRMRKGIDFNFPTNLSLAAGGFLVLVNFDPMVDAAELAAFRAAYGSSMTLLGPYSGRLDNNSEAIELQKPDAPQTIPGPDFGLVPFITVDRVVYGDSSPWPTAPDGGGASLKRIAATLYGNDPANWTAGPPTPGVVNSTGPQNSPPLLAPIGNKSVNEGVTLSFTASATDTDTPPQTLTFTLDAGAPSGASITPGGAFTWTPQENQGPGVYAITVRASDTGAPILSDFETIQVTVNEVNSAPALNPIGNKLGDEGSLITFTATAIDPDLPAQPLTYSLDPGAPDGASITAGGVFTWVPAETNGPGVYSVTVRVTDNGTPPRADTETITITVNEANNPPVLNAIGNKTVNEGTTLSFTATATDSDQPAQTLTFSLDAGAPAGAAITTGGVFSWNPSESQGPGTNQVTVRVTDNGTPPATAFEVITIVVNEVNTSPVLNPIGNHSVQAGSLLTFTAMATDSDLPVQNLRFTLDPGAPPGASLTTNGVFTWTPSAADGPSNYTVTVRVTDNGVPAMSDAETIQISVGVASVALVLVDLTNTWRYVDTGPDLGTAWKEIDFIDASWPAGRALLYNETNFTPAPKNTLLSLTNPAGGRVITYYFRTHFNLPADAAGVTLVSTNALDDGSVIYLNGTEAARINMNPGGVTAATLSASSWEATNFFVTNVSATALVTGDNVLAVEVHQQSATSSDVVFGLSLTATIPPQTPIAITSQPGNQTVTAGSTAQFSVGVTGGHPLYQWLKNGSPVPGAAGPTLSLTNAQAGDAGMYQVVVSNLVSAATSASVTLTVNPPPNTPPVLNAIGDRLVTEGQLLSFTASATDGDLPAQKLTYTLDPGFPAGAAINATNGQFSWTPPAGWTPVTNSITIRVTDNGSAPLSDSETIRVVVAGAPRILSISSLAGQVTIQWSSMAGKTYRVEWKAALNEPAWQPLGGTIQAAGSTSATTDTIGANVQRFYRVVLID
jgi:hypothetical protein